MSTQPQKMSDLSKAAPKSLLDESMPESKQAETESQSPDLSNLIGGQTIEQIMNSEGPIVKAVVLKADGTAVEIDYDTTPRKHLVKEILGADPTIIGQWHQLQVILVKGVIESLNVPRNKHSLRWPFGNEDVRGDILCYRVDDNATPTDFTLAEYKAFAAKADEDASIAAQFEADKAKAEAEEGSADDADEDGDGDDEEVIALDRDIMQAQVQNMVRRQFAAKYGREPTDDEVTAFSQAVLGQFFGEAGGDGDEEDQDEDADEDYVPEEDEVEEDDEEEEEREMAQLVDEDNDEEPLVAPPVDENDDKTQDEEFQKEFASALDGVRQLAVSQRAKILAAAKEKYEAETGEEVEDETMNQAFSLLKVKLYPGGRIEEEEEEDDAKDGSEGADEEEAQLASAATASDQAQPGAMVEDGPENDEEEEAVEEDDEEEVEPEVPLSEDELRKEIAEAFEAVRARGRFDGQRIASMVAETFYEINGREADSSDIAEVFSRIKAKLAEEAAEELIYDDDETINDTVQPTISEQVDAVVAQLPTTTDGTMSTEADRRKQLLEYSRTVVTQSMARKAREQFMALSKREPTMEEFEDLMITLATTRLIDAEFDSDNESDEDYNPEATVEKLQEEKDEQESVEEDAAVDSANAKADAFDVLGAYDSSMEPARKEPVAFFSPVRTNKTKQFTDYSTLNETLMKRAVKHFENIHKREPTEEEKANLGKFLTTAGLDYDCSDDDENDSDYDPTKDTTCDEEADEEMEARFEEEFVAEKGEAPESGDLVIPDISQAQSEPVISSTIGDAIADN